MKTLAATLTAGLATTGLLFAGDPAPAPSAPAVPTAAKADATIFPIPDLTGSIWDRDRLLGDLWGPRETLAEHGVQFDFTLTQIYQGVMSGGNTDQWAQSVGNQAIQTLLGQLVDPLATARNQIKSQINALAQQRLQQLGAQAQARFDMLPTLAQVLIQRRIAEVPASTWQNLRAEVRNALNSKIASGQDALNSVVQDKIGKLDLGNFGNTGQNSQGYFGDWSFETKIDTAKAGLWPGGFISMRVEGQYGDAVNARSGALLPSDVSSLLPEPGLDAVTIPHLYLTQFLSEHLAIVAGKLDTTGGDMNEFAHISGGDRFLGTAFAFNPVTALFAPYSTLGAAVVILPTKDWDIQFSAMDGDGVPTRSGFDTLFKGKTTYATETRFATHFFGLPGHQLFGGMVGNGSYTRLSQDPLAFVPDSGVPLSEARTAWGVYYNFDQYLWTRPDDPERGWGLFGRFGYSDQSVNPIAQFYSAGFGGKGVCSARPHDLFGAGYYYMKTSNDLPSLLQLGDEQGVEVYYTLAVTPACMITADLQVTNSAKEHVDTAVIGGLRATLRF